jgi:Camelysin metallo-endopeptidase
MSRLKVLAGSPRLALGGLLTLLLAAGAVVGSGASFTASSANPANTFSSGTLTMDNSEEGSAILTASNMRPGDATNGTVDIQNNGSLSGDFTLSRTAPVDSGSASPISEKLNVTVIDCGEFVGATQPTCDAGDVTKYSGTLAAMGTTALDSYDAGEKHRYEFRVELDGSAGNEYQGGSSTVQFNFDAV